MNRFSRCITKGNKLLLLMASIVAMTLSTQSIFAGPVHAFFADEHNTSPTSTTGNRILEIDVDNMSLVNSLDVPGNLGHHADNGFNSKIYGVPKGSNFVNVIELRKDQNNNTSMQNTKQVTLIHKPRSGDAFNKKFNVILMAATNRPMGSFINVETDEVVGTIGENVDCTLTDGTSLLSHSDANTPAGALKYQCSSGSHGGNQVSGHPYWLTPDYAAIIDRTNNQISVYRVWSSGSQINSELVNHLPTRTSIHQIVPRDRTNLPASQQSDFYAIEEGAHTASTNDYSGGVAHALLKLRLTTNGLQLERRMNLQRTQVLPKSKADRILNACISIYRSTFNQALTGPSAERERRYNTLFRQEGITRSPDQDLNNDFPIDCFYPGIPGGHNADFAPNNKHLYVPMAGGAVAVVDVNRWKIANSIDIGIRSGVGHMCFSEKNNVALSSNHGFSTIFNQSFTRTIRYINSERPIGYYWIALPFTRENITNTMQSHTCYIDKNEDFYYNFFTDGGVFYKIDLKGVFNNPRNGRSDLVVDSLYTGGIPIQGSYIDIDTIKSNTPNPTFAANNDTATSTGDAVTIDVLANDTGSNLELEVVDTADNGTVQLVNRKAVYTPNAGFNGKDGFWYGVSSPNIGWKWAFVEVTVTTTTPPTGKATAGHDSVTISGNGSATIDILANDTGPGLTITYVDVPNYGTAVISNGKLIYTPPANPPSGYAGVDDFWYEITDTNGEMDWGNIIITTGVPAQFQANPDTVSVRKGGTVTIDVLANDTGNGLVLSTIDTVWKGSIRQSGNKIIYTDDASVSGNVETWYGVLDASGNIEKWTSVNITIQ